MDRLVWKAKRNGLYYVRSSYRIFIQDIVNYNYLQKPGYWSGIWKLKVPPKVRNLIWRVCRDCFPTCVKLISRGVNWPSGCVTCNDLREDSYLQCKTIIDVWREAYVWHLISPSLNQFDNWWIKPQVHGSTEVVKREYRSNRELLNLISFNWWLERDFSWKGLIFNGRK